VFGWLSTDLGRLIGEATSLPITYLVLLADLFAGLPFASAHISLPAALAISAAAIIAGRAFIRGPVAPDEEDRPRPLRLSFALQTSVVMTLLATLLFGRSLTTTNDYLEVTVLDVGQGDAILIETPDGHVVLVDGGPSVSRLLNELGAALPRSEHRIDLVVLSHPQEDHVAGLVGLFDRYDVGAVLAGPREGTTGAYDAWRERIAAAETPMIVAERGLTADLGDGIELSVLGPPPEGVHGGADELNENSVVLQLSYGEVSFLLTGDLGFLGEEALLRSGAGLHSTVLKVGHHGSDGSTSAAFLDAVQPEAAVVSAGAENSFGHPSPTTRLRLAGIPLLRTDLNGRVSFETDGRSVWLETERGKAEVVPAGLVEK
jgi:competence protein ComEC